MAAARRTARRSSRRATDSRPPAAPATPSPTPGTSASTGPDLDTALKGKDAAFIKQSIVDPDAVVTQGYNKGIMPTNFGQTLSAAEQDALVSYLQKATGG